MIDAIESGAATTPRSFMKNLCTRRIWTNSSKLTCLHSLLFRFASHEIVNLLHVKAVGSPMLNRVSSTLIRLPGGYDNFWHPTAGRSPCKHPLTMVDLWFVPGGRWVLYFVWNSLNTRSRAPQLSCDNEYKSLVDSSSSERNLYLFFQNTSSIWGFLLSELRYVYSPWNKRILDTTNLSLSYLVTMRLSTILPAALACVPFVLGTCVLRTGQIGACGYSGNTLTCIKPQNAPTKCDGQALKYQSDDDFENRLQCSSQGVSDVCFVRWHCCWKKHFILFYNGKRRCVYYQTHKKTTAYFIHRARWIWDQRWRSTFRCRYLGAPWSGRRWVLVADRGNVFWYYKSLDTRLWLLRMHRETNTIQRRNLYIASPFGSTLFVCRPSGCEIIDDESYNRAGMRQVLHSQALRRATWMETLEWDSPGMLAISWYCSDKQIEEAKTER